MRILSLDTTPIATIRFANAGRKGQELRQLPVLVGRVDQLPAGVDGLVLAADLQGREESALHDPRARLVGEVVPERLAAILVQAGLPPPKTCGAILAGDLFTVPLVTRRGGSGDVTAVWQAWSVAFRWVAGVAGNHDTFGGRASPPPRLRGNRRMYFLESTVRTIGGVRFGGVFGALGNPRRHNSFDEPVFVAQLWEVLFAKPDVVVLHDGPDAAEDQRGRAVLREILDSSPPGLPGLVVRGHCYWPRPLGVLSGGTQVLNVDGRVVVLVH